MAITTIGYSGTQSPTPHPAAPQGTPSLAGKVPADVSAPTPQQPPPAQIQKAVESLRQMIEAKAPNSMAFSLDSSTGKTIVRITDAQTGETIRQIPSEEILEIARSLDRLQGTLITGKA